MVGHCSLRPVCVLLTRPQVPLLSEAEFLGISPTRPYALDIRFQTKCYVDFSTSVAQVDLSLSMIQ